MANNRFELHEERIATTDDQGHRVYIHPENVKGFWRTQRTRVYSFLIIIYLVLPWIQWNDKQIILLNIPGREFSFFGTTFYAHDAPLILLLLLGFVFTMGLITSIWGRAWCGWACPQTVFIDTVYLKIEQLIEGKARARQKLQEMPWNGEKILKKALKWGAFILVSVTISNSMLGYFVGARRLFAITLAGPSGHMTLFYFSMSFTALFLFDFGWFREQFCLVACPYGRFQSVMMDENSLVVAYDAKRGEPRRGKAEDKNAEGDCINCYHCVKVCPTGIDIRRGTQLECIACTNCIDACDEIMTKLNRPTGLVRFDTENALEGKPTKRFGIRSVIYIVAITVVFSTLVYNLLTAGHLKVTFVRGTGRPYSERTLPSGEIEVMNLYKARFDYKDSEKLEIDFRVKDPENRKEVKVITPKRPFKLHSGKSKSAIIHFKFRPSFLNKGSRKILLEFYDQSGKVQVTKEVNLVGPLQ